MKKALPYVLSVGVGIVVLYGVYHFRTTRLLPQQLEEMRQASDRLAEVEQHEHAHEQVAPDEEVPEEFFVAFECSNGDFLVHCYRDWAPHGAKRFYDLVKAGFYDNNRVFRVVPEFVVQFGLSGDPALNAKWADANIPDDPVVESNSRGRVSFAATSMPNSRSTQIFVNLSSKSSNIKLDRMGFAPIGEIGAGMETVDSFYAGYGEEPSSLQTQIKATGNAILDSQFPNLSTIKRAYLVESPQAFYESRPSNSSEAGTTEESEPETPQPQDPSTNP
ncbi:MAG: hypothetical protein AMXMBFR82_36160 [Candidatus Hydrogenedentota bacterium]